MAAPSNISITIRSWSVPAGILGAVLLVGQIALSSVLGAAQGTSNPYEIYDPLLYVLYNSLFDGALILFAVGLVGLLYGHRQAAEQQHRHQQSSSSSRWLARMGLFLALGAGASAAVSILFALMVGLWPALSVVGAFFTQLLAVLCLVVGLGLLGIISVMRSAALEGWVSSLRWRWVLLIFGIGVVAALLSEMLEIVMSSYIPVVDIKGTHLGHVLVTFFVAVWVARKVGTSPVLYGILVGLISGIINQLYFHVLVVTPGSLNWREVMITVPLSVVAGWLGGVVARATLAEQETLYRASRAIGEASGQQDIVDAIGEHLADPQVSHVALWQDVVSGTEEGDTSELSLLAVWMPWVARVWGPGVWRPGLRLDVAQLPALATLKRHQHSPVVLKVRKLAASERAVWEHQGIRSAVLLPLVVSSGAAQLGVLMVASRSIYGFSRVKMRTYSTLAAQVALVLENLRLLEEAQQAGVSSERQRLAHEIHDTLAQGFTSIVMNLEAAEGMLPSGLSSVQQYLDQARSIARESLAEARRLMWALRPESLERSSLPEALSRLAESFSEESGGTAAASTTVTGTPQPLTPEIEVTLLRVAQEALANCRKHAQASRVAITLSYMNNLVALNVQDDGVGFDPNQLGGGGGTKKEEPAGAQSTGGFGLVGMRERVEQLRGTLLVESAPAEGTTLMVAIPLATTSNQPPGTPEALKATSSSPSSPRETL